MKGYDYSDYESRWMDRDTIRMLQRPRLRFFKDCKRILDLACGPGIFLELLREAGHEAIGVDRNEEIVRKVRQRGLNAVSADAFEFLAKAEAPYDGIFCSHFLEHLPFDQVVQMIALIASKLESGGVLVIVLPNPGSIRLHLFGFWRDPEHTRFYTGSLIASVCQHYGFRIESSNEEETPNLLETPRLEPLPMDSLDSRWKGLFTGKKEAVQGFVEAFNQNVEEFNRRMEGILEALNKIWARDDEVVIVGRRLPKGTEG